ncbi:unnamed protein product [Sphacelaria rigidula]
MINKVFLSIIVSIIFFISLGLNVVTSKNPVYSIFYLVLLFITGACLIALFGCDYLSLIFILVYVGAIAVLFLFVIMILDIKIVNKIDFDSSVKNLQILYTDFTLWFLLCGGILLVAMIGCISLALPSKQELNINLSKSDKFSRRIKTVTYKKGI